MYICLFEDDLVSNLYPLTYTRASYDLRTGRRTLRERARDVFGAREVLVHARKEIAHVAATHNGALVNRLPGGLDVLFLNGAAVWQPGPAVEQILATTSGGRPTCFMAGQTVVAAWMPDATPKILDADAINRTTFGEHANNILDVELEGVRVAKRLWDLIDEIPNSIEQDFQQVSAGFRLYERPGTTVHESALLAEGERIYLAPGVRVRPGAILSAENGPVIVDEGATIFERAVVRGPAYVGKGSHIKVGANVEEVVFGPHSKVGGEVGETIVQGYSNKAHDGHLGNAYLGSWCNLGAGTDNSNLKNDYGSISVFNVGRQEMEDSGKQFLGLFMGDHSKCGIGTTFNTGTVVGVCCNLYGSGFHPRYVPSFCWGGPDAYETYRLDKALTVARVVMGRRNRTLEREDEDLLRALFGETRPQRDRFLDAFKHA